MTRQTLITLALGSCTLGMLPVACNNGQSDTDQESIKAPAIQVFNIRQQKVTDYGEWFGYLRGDKETDIHPRVSGFLKSQNYRDGQFVKEGDILFTIEDDLFKAQLRQAQANLQASEAALEAAKAQREKAALDVKRYEQLEPKAVSEKDLTDARQNLKAAVANEKSAQASVNQMKAAVKQAQINLDYTVIKAPYNGVAGAAQASQGDMVSPATTLANITAVNPILVNFSVNGKMLLDAFRDHGKLSTAETAPPIYLITDDGKEYPYPGKFKAMESKVSGDGTINFEAEFPNQDLTLRAGMSVRVKLPLSEHEALLVPPSAIRQVMRNNFIIVVDKNRVPHMVPVTVGKSYPISVQEADGYHSEQKLVAISDYGSTRLSELFRQYGYDKATEVPVVADKDNGVQAMNISSANSRLGKGEKPTAIDTTAFSFKPVADAAMMSEQQGNKKAASDAKATLPPFVVKVRPMIRQDVKVQSEWFGKLRGEEETDIRPHVSGFLKSQNFKDGSMVKKGDVLFTIDPAPYQAEVEQAEANLSAAKAAREQADAELAKNTVNYERLERLSKEAPGAVSDKNVTDAATAVKTAKAALLKADATVAQMEAALQLAQINLGYTTITAPFDGRIGIRKPSIGALVSPQDAEPLVTLSSVNPMRVDFQVSGKNALSGFTRFRKNMTAGNGRKREDFDLILNDGSTYPHKGRIVNSDNALSKSTGTLTVIGQVDNAEGLLRSGMPVRVRAGMQGGENSILVPARAPLNSKGKDLLVLLRPDNTPDMLPISKGALVNVPVKESDGKEVLQPMQVVDVDRPMLSAAIAAKAGAPSTEAMVLGGAGVKDWGELLLKQSGEPDFRTLLEKQSGEKFPDDAPQQAHVKDWKELYLRRSGARSFRELVLDKAGAKDELDLIAAGQGFKTPMEMMLKGMGYDSLESARVVAEGSLMAAQAYGANLEAGARVNKLTPVDYHYKAPTTVVGSVTAESEKK